MSIYRGMFEACLITVDQNGESIIPYYNKEKLEFYIEDYFEKNIERYSKDYLIDIKFLDDDKYELCSFDCRAVSINLKAKINMFYNYDKTQLFEVVSRENL